MKKLLAILLSVLMLCTMIPFATVSAAAEEGINIVVEVSEEYVNAGDEFEVTVYLEGNPGVIAACLELEFDSNAMELYGEWDGADFYPEISHPRKWKTNFITYGPNEKTCVVNYINGTASSNVTEEEFFTAVFVAKEDAYTGDYELNVKYNPANFFAYTGVPGKFDPVAVAGVENGSITINGAEPPACKHQYDFACSEACALCGEAREPEKEHTYSADCDVTCDVCEAKRESAVAHEYLYACEQYCKNCGEKTNPSGKHSMIHVEAKEATCAEPGNIEYWTCEHCNICWDNANGTGWQLNMKTIQITVEHTLPEGLPLCADAVCSVCKQLVEGWAHEPVNGIYCQPGECLYCGEFVDAFSGHETNAWPPCADGNCLYCGIELTGQCVSNAEYACQDGICIHCGEPVPGTAHEYFSDCEGVCLICNEETREASHNIVHVEAKAPTCSALGNIEYWFCDVCGMAWLDEACTMNTNQFAVRLPMAEHTYFDACSAICDVCGYEREVSHNVVHVEAKAATCAENGNIEYWYCDVCGMAWLDAACTLNTNLRAVITPATGEHTYDDDYDADCNACGYIREVLIPIAVLNNLGNSVCPDVTGLAFGFSVNVDSIQVEGNKFLGGSVVPFNNGAAYNLSSMGAILSNEADAELVMENVNDSTIKNVPAVLLYDVDAADGVVEFAVRIVNIPNHGQNVTISARPYFVYSTAAGEEIVVYGDIIASSYNEALK